jgi:hypothetical protein
MFLLRYVVAYASTWCSKLSAKGAGNTSLGQRPRIIVRNRPALKGRHKGLQRFVTPLQGCEHQNRKPRALPWAGMSRAFGASDLPLAHGLIAACGAEKENGQWMVGRHWSKCTNFDTPAKQCFRRAIS